MNEPKLTLPTIFLDMPLAATVAAPMFGNPELFQTLELYISHDSHMLRSTIYQFQDPSAPRQSYTSSPVMPSITRDLLTKFGTKLAPRPLADALASLTFPR